jgi:nucleotide-binding universal stress UspA family protein
MGTFRPGSSSNSEPITPEAIMNQSPTRSPVVVGVSGDQPALLSYAVGMAQMLDSPLRVVHAHAFGNAGELHHGRDAGTTGRQAGERALEHARERLANHAGLDVEYALHAEPPAFALQTESKDAAIVVVGTDDVGWFDRLTGANVAQRVALHSSCPVLVVPTGSSAPSVDDIVIALDVDNVVKDALDFGFDLAERTGAAVRVVTVLPSDFDPEERDWRDGRLRGYVAEWHQRFPHANARHEVITGRPADVLSHGSARARLLVVGRPDQPHRAPLLSRRVATSLLRTTQYPVAVIPAGHPG